MNVILRFIRKPMLLKIKTIVKAIPFSVVDFDVFYRLERIKHPDILEVVDQDIDIRFANINDVDALNKCVNKNKLYKKRFNNGDYCIIAIAIKSKCIVGYEWFSTLEKHIEERYKYELSIPGDAIYAYDAFVRDNYRGKRIWSAILQKATRIMVKENRKKIITNVDYGNNLSIRVHIKRGFMVTSIAFYIQLFKFKLIKEKHKCS